MSYHASYGYGSRPQLDYYLYAKIDINMPESQSHNMLLKMSSSDQHQMMDWDS